MKTKRSWWIDAGRLLLGTVAVLVLSGQARAIAQQVLDICGCAGDPTLQPFDAGNPATYPPGTSGCSGPCTSGNVTLPLPPDGVLRFSSFTASGFFNIGFTRNEANTPVTLLVAGNVTLQAPGCCTGMSVGGNSGSNGNSQTAGVGGLGGNGGFRGGDGAALPINGFTIGGSGFGPGGGRGGTAAGNPGGGTFFGLPELLPLVGGSGGGGGSSFGSSSSCTGGGGGGGGGGLLIAANGTITITNVVVNANGGGGGSQGNGGCSRSGAGGSGGAIRLVAGRFAHGGNGYVRASAGSGSAAGSQGRVRLESVDDSAQTAFNTDDPAALRITGPGPLANPLAPTARITAISGNAIGATPQGGTGAIDVVLPAPGVTGVDVATAGVPSGTSVEVTVKPRVGADPQAAIVPLTNCDTLGHCSATATFNLAAGAYVVEARATFQVE